MMKSIFDEKFDEGFAASEARGKAEGEDKMLAKFLNLRFKRLPKTLSNCISLSPKINRQVLVV